LGLKNQKPPAGMESVAAAVLSPEFISLVTAHLPGNRSKQTSSKVPL